jgi:hypothetical protein
MTESEARAKFPKAHLVWVGTNHCWTFGTVPVHARISLAAVPMPSPRPEIAAVPVPSSPPEIAAVPRACVIALIAGAPQPRNVRRNPPRLILAERAAERRPGVDISERLAVAVAHDKAGVLFLGGPGGGKRRVSISACRGCPSRARGALAGRHQCPGMTYVPSPRGIA